jgi:hypothetical protein
VIKMIREVKKITDIENLEFEDIDYSDFPEFQEAHISSATWRDTGEDLTDEELEAIDGCIVYNAVMQHIY